MRCLPERLKVVSHDSRQQHLMSSCVYDVHLVWFGTSSAH